MKNYGTKLGQLRNLIEEIGEEYCNDDTATGDYRTYLADKLLYNGVILPPVKVGDTVWDNDFGCPESYTVTGLDIGKTMDDEVEHSELFVYYRNWNNSITCSAPISTFGKTVFLSREEAEAALERLKGGAE